MSLFHHLLVSLAPSETSRSFLNWSNTADAADAFAKAALRLFDDVALKERLAENAYETVKTQYVWEAKNRELVHALSGVVEREL